MHSLDAGVENDRNRSSHQYQIFRIVEVHFDVEVGLQCPPSTIDTKQNLARFNPLQTASSSQWSRPSRFPHRRVILQECS